MSSRRPRSQTHVILAVFGVSILVHALAVVFFRFGGAEASVRKAQVAESERLRFSCEADANLVFAARASMCASPFGGPRLACLDDARLQLELDRTRCSAVEISMVDDATLPPEPPPIPIPPPPTPQPQPMTALLQPQDPVEVQKQEEKKIEEKVEEVKKKREDPKKPGQVVEITQPTLEKAPDDARFLAEYDSSVSKETVARGSTEKMVARPEKADGPTKEEVKPEPAQPEGPPKPEGPDKSMLALKGPGEGNTPQSSPETGALDGASELSPDGILPKKGPGLLAMRSREPSSEMPGGGSELDAAPNSLFPSKEVVEKAIGGGSVDKLDGVASGDSTGLNAKQWKFAGFFNRMKRQVAQNWHPGRVYMRRDPTGKVYGNKSRTTILNVSLHPDGRLARAWVADGSGVDFLDDEAIKAFQLAQPFPNPPGALVENGLINFRFGFHFQIGNRSAWKIFRKR